VAVPPPGDSRRREVGAVALAAGSVLSGVFAYLYIAIGTRHYGTDDFSGVAQLWTIWFFGSSVLTFPLQHWVIQRLRIDGHGGAVRAVLPRLSAIALGLGAAVSLVTYLAHRDLFDRSDLVYPLAAGAITVGAAAMGLLRGGLAGRSRFVATATALGGENAVRLGLGVVVIAAGAGVGLYGAAIVSGVLVIFLWPDALRFEGPPPEETVSPLAFLGNVAGGTVIAQSVLTGGPVVLSLAGGTRSEVTSLFTALALFRAPYIVALGMAIRVTAHLTDLAAADAWDALDRLRRRTAIASVGVMALGGAGAAVLGPTVLRIIFGDEVDLTRLECAGLAVGSLAALATLGLTLVQMTHGAGRRVLQAWAIGLAAGVIGMVALPLDPLPRVVAAFLASELTAFALMALLDGSRERE
jgi:O-antigen/teichoic acid export membrane protein